MPPALGWCVKALQHATCTLVGTWISQCTDKDVGVNWWVGVARGLMCSYAAMPRTVNFYFANGKANWTRILKLCKVGHLVHSTLRLSTTIAAQAYERVLELDSSNADALLGLASIKFNSSNVQQACGFSRMDASTKQGLADGLQFLVRAYTLDPTNVGTLVMLAHYCLIKGEHDKVRRSARVSAWA
eukprot:1159143-Pelagomonas_calceolata.AAC.5